VIFASFGTRYDVIDEEFLAGLLGATIKTAAPMLFYKSQLPFRVFFVSAHLPFLSFKLGVYFYYENGGDLHPA
jgi:hypothetical protein